MSKQPFTAFASRTVVLPATNIDTDQIIPARFLSTTTRAGLGAVLFADWRYDPSCAPRPVPTMSAVGVARPSEQGQAITITDTAAINPPEGFPKNSHHPRNAATAQATMTGTNTAATLSTIR